MKFKIGATIPTVQYGNLQPEIEVEADTFEEAYAEAMPHIIGIWNNYVEEGKQLGNSRQKLEAFVGGSIYFDPLTHTYSNEAGEVYLSGSQYAKRFEKPFDKLRIADAMAKKTGDDPAKIIQMWELKASASRNLGTAIHQAFELYETHKDLSERLKKETHVHTHPLLEKPVKSFYAAHKGEIARSEIVVVDHVPKHAGQIDRLLILGDKLARVQDFKSNENIEKSLDMYWQQLHFYAQILIAGGWEIQGLDIFAYNGEWKEFNKELKEIE